MNHSHFFANADLQAFADVMEEVNIEKMIDVTGTYSVINVGRNRENRVVISVQGASGVHVLSEFPLGSGI